MSTECFVAEQNVLLLAEKYRNEPAPVLREVIKRILLSEEDKFANAGAHAEALSRMIADGKTRIARQHMIVQLAAHNGDAARAETVLANMIRLQEIFEHRLALMQKASTL